eukprot:SAG11_NODE_32431_length_283_cov_1.413043_1_plen_30_part_10
MLQKTAVTLAYTGCKGAHSIDFALKMECLS